jgi:putative exosortase-associated protein (TIGR04073 family)
MLLIVMLLMPVSFALASDVWTMAQSDKYSDKAGGMLGRGAVNAATCFVDILVQTVNGTKDGPPLLGTLAGLGGGIGCTALRAVSGVLDIGTFWVPGFNGFPVSKSYDNCLCANETCGEAQPVAAVAAAPQPTYVAPVAATPVEPVHAPTKYVKK